MQLTVALFAPIPTGVSSAFAYETLRRREAVAELLRALEVLLAGIIVAAWFASVLWAVHAGRSVELVEVVAVIPAATLLACQQNVYVALGWLRPLNNQVVGVALATFLGVALALAVLPGNTTAAVVVWILTSCGAALVIAVRLGRLTGRGSTLPLGAGVARLFKRGAVSSLSGIVSTLNYRVDAVFVAVMLGKAAFGIYSVAFGVAEVLLLIARSLTTAVSREIAEGNPDAAARLTAASTRAITIATTCGAAILLVAGPPLLHDVLGPRFDGAATPLRILLVGIIALASNASFTAFFVLHLGRPAVTVGVNTTMTSIQAAFCALLLPHLGLEGAALGASATYVLGAAFNTVLLCRATGLSPVDVWLPRRGDLVLLSHTIRQLRRAVSGAPRK